MIDRAECPSVSDRGYVRDILNECLLCAWEHARQIETRRDWVVMLMK